MQALWGGGAGLAPVREDQVEQAWQGAKQGPGGSWAQKRDFQGQAADGRWTTSRHEAWMWIHLEVTRTRV